MTQLRQYKGKQAETAGVKLLKKSGMEIICRNYRCRLGEIDIVALDGDVVVFVEVRSRSGTGYGLPQESIGTKKIHKIRTVANYYIMVNGTNAGGYRFDVIAVMLSKTGDVKGIQHIKDAF